MQTLVSTLGLPSHNLNIIKILYALLGLKSSGPDDGWTATQPPVVRMLAFWIASEGASGLDPVLSALFTPPSITRDEFSEAQSDHA